MCGLLPLLSRKDSSSPAFPTSHQEPFWRCTTSLVQLMVHASRQNSNPASSNIAPSRELSLHRMAVMWRQRLRSPKQSRTIDFTHMFLPVAAALVPVPLHSWEASEELFIQTEAMRSMDSRGSRGGGEAGFACNLLKTVRKLPQLSQEKVRKVYSEDSENAEALAKEVPHLNSQLLELQSRIAQLNKNGEYLLCKLLGGYIQGDLQEIERRSALLSRRWMQMVQQRRVSSKLLDHIFATTTSGVRPLTRQELEELAVITDDGN